MLDKQKKNYKHEIMLKVAPIKKYLCTKLMKLDKKNNDVTTVAIRFNKKSTGFEHNFN